MIGFEQLHNPKNFVLLLIAFWEFGKAFLPFAQPN
jgi:hypothetical protein